MEEEEAYRGTSPVERKHLTVLESGRLIVRTRSPFLLSSVYGLVPIATESTPSSFVTPGLVFGYNPKFISTCTDEEAAFVMLHEVFHDRLRFFDIVKSVGEQLAETANTAQDLHINQLLASMGYPVFSWAHMPQKYNLPEKLSTMEYIDLLLKDENKKKKPGHQCRASSEAEKEFDQKYGRTEVDVRAIERQTANAIKQHMQANKGQRGFGSSLLEEWAKLVEPEPVTINWRQLIDRLTLDLHGQVIVGGDDFSLYRPSKRSHIRGIVRPGLIEHEMVPMFVFDTSASVNIEQLVIGLRHSIAVLMQCGVQECYFMEVDSSVVTQPKLVNMSYFLQEDFKFTGRGGTSFIPAFKALQEMPQKPDIMWYWTDGDGQAPKHPPPGVEVIWGVLPNMYSRRPAPWGHLIVISEDPRDQQRIEQSQPHAYYEEEQEEDEEEDEDD